MTVQQATRQLLFQLYHVYDEREAKNICDLVMENITEWQRIDRIMNKQVPLSNIKEKLLEKYTAELLAHRPVQYVLQESWFFGMKLYVDERVLIPRPETESLLAWVLEDCVGREQGLVITDIGTGSGCIAIGLKKKLPSTDVFGCDASEAALAVARQNASAQHTGIEWVHCNFLNKEERKSLPTADIIISNPPYIPESDSSAMQPNVLLHEPHLALFVKDDDPLVFYQAIAAHAKTALRAGGSVYVEIHEQMAAAVQQLFSEAGFTDILLKQDLQEKDRMVRCRF